MDIKNMTLSVLLLFTFSVQINGLKILTVLPTQSKSHWFIGSSIAKTLAEVGHEVTVISCFPLKNPPKNYRDVGMEDYLEAGQQATRKFNPANLPSIVIMYFLRSMVLQFTEQVLTHPNVIKLLNDKTENFDLVLVELFVAPALLGFGQHFNAPVIGFATSGSAKWTNDVTGNTAPLSYVPNIFTDTTSRMKFSQRLKNAMLTTLENFFDFIFESSQKKLYEKHFPDAKKSYSEMVKNEVSLVFLNTHLSLHPAVPYLPNTIEIGGIHVERDIKPLPEDLKQFIESAEHGVIYFSLGSNIKSYHFTYEIQQSFVKAFSELREKVIWKFDKSDVDNLSENVLINSWCPQNDILAHPNVKLFISHGGLLSLTETIYHGKPTIGIPYFGDQKANVAFAEEKGFGYKLNQNELTFDLISKALKTVLSNRSYAENVKRVSNIFHDQPMTPKEKLIYWVEYVIRHKGALHLESLGQELSFIEYHMIDVFAFILMIAIVNMFIIFVCIRFICRKIFLKKAKVE